MGFLSDIGDFASSVASKAASIASDAVDTAVGAGVDATLWTAGAVSDAGKAVNGAIGDVFVNGYKLADGVIDFATDNIPYADSAWDAFKSALGAGVDGVLAVGKFTGNAIEDGFDLLARGAYQAADAALHPVRTAEDVVGTVKEKAKELFD